MKRLFIFKKAHKNKLIPRKIFAFVFIFALVINLSFGLFIKTSSAQSLGSIHKITDKNVEPLFTIAPNDTRTGEDFGVNLKGQYTGGAQVSAKILDWRICAFEDANYVDMLSSNDLDCGGNKTPNKETEDTTTLDIEIDYNGEAFERSNTIDTLKPSKDYFITVNYVAEILGVEYYGYTNVLWVKTGPNDTSSTQVLTYTENTYPSIYAGTPPSPKLTGYSISNYKVLSNNVNVSGVLNVSLTVSPKGNKAITYTSIKNISQGQITVEKAGPFFYKDISNIKVEDSSGSNTGSNLDEFNNLVINPGEKKIFYYQENGLSDDTFYYTAVQYKATDADGKSVFGYGGVMQFKSGSSSTEGEIINPLVKQGASNVGDTSVVEDTGSPAKTEEESILPICSLGFFDKANWSGCFAVFFYYVVFKPAAWVMGIAGSILDFGIYYSTKSTNYNTGQVFIENGWKMTRDISNLLFIFVILFNAVQLIIGAKGSSKSILVSMILVGIFINFSLFAGRVIIDAGNIMSRVMYNAITITGDSNPNSTTIKPLSTFIVQKFNPQQLILDQKNSQLKEGGSIEDLVSSSDYAYNFMLLSIAVGVIALLTAWLFFTCGFVFIGRTVTLWLYLILSPFAFISQIWNAPFLAQISKGTGIDVSSISAWAKGLARASFAIVAFLFFIVLIIKFTNGYQFLGPNLSDQSLVAKTLNVLIPFIFIYFILQASKDIAVSLSGKFGEMVEKAGKAATGAALTAASFATGMAATRALGAIGGAAEAKYGAKLATSASKGGLGGWAARKTLDATRGAQNKEFNFANTGLGKMASSKLGGAKLGAGIVGAMQGTGRAFGADMKTEGGFKGAVDRQTKRKEEEEKKYAQLSGDAATAIDKKAFDWERKYQEEMALSKARAEAAGTAFNKETFTADFIVANKARPKTSEQINLENQRVFAERNEKSIYKGYRKYADKTLKPHKEKDIKKQQADWDKAYLQALQTKINDVQADHGRPMTDAEKKIFTSTYIANNGSKPMTDDDVKKKIVPEDKTLPKEKEFKQNAEKINKLKIERTIITNSLANVRTRPGTENLTERQLLDIAHSETEEAEKEAKRRITRLSNTPGTPPIEIIRARTDHKNLGREKAILKNKTLSDIDYEIADLEEKNKLS